MYRRELNLPNLLEKKSFFLFGPRSTGKTTLIREQLAQEAIVIDLLKSRTLLHFTNDPGNIEDYILTQKKSSKLTDATIVIDEIQKLPMLLNEVHRLIEERKWRFLLTGSSAKKLKEAGVNLLGGRAWIAEMFPLCFAEIKEQFHLERVLRYGSLPHIYTSKLPEEELDSYVTTYLKDEVQAESLVRKIPAFTDFLRLSAHCNSKLLNYNQLSQELGVSQPTIRSYYQILEETFLGFNLDPWHESKKRKSIQNSKFYMFDLGVIHTLIGTESLDRKSQLYGDSFETFIINEVRAYISYRRKKMPLNFWRTENGDEVDLVIGRKLALEIKATQRVSQKDLKGLLRLQEENLIDQYMIVTQDPLETTKSNIRCMHWENFLNKLWLDQII